MRLGILISILAVALIGTTRGAVTLPMRTVFKGQDRFEQLVVRAKAENWKMLPIGSGLRWWARRWSERLTVFSRWKSITGLSRPRSISRGSIAGPF